MPADIRLIEGKELSINEAILTGEWMAVIKEAEKQCAEGTVLGERTNMAWMGTLVSSGYGIGVVVHIGSETQIGAIAQQLQFTDKRVTPLQHSMRRIARFLVYVILAAVTIIFFLGLLNGESVSNMVLVVIAVSVASMPTGLSSLLMSWSISL